MSEAVVIPIAPHLDGLPGGVELVARYEEHDLYRVDVDEFFLTGPDEYFSVAWLTSVLPDCGDRDWVTTSVRSRQFALLITR